MTRYAFGDFRLDTDRMELRGVDGPVAVEPQVFDVLRYLVENNDRLVTKEDLLDNVWGDRFVSESALTTRIKQARRLIGDDGSRQALIQTVRGRGFRFVAEVGIESTARSRRDRDAQASAPSTSATERLTILPRGLDADFDLPFVGREDELGQAMVVLDAHDARLVRWIVAIGEPGIGKTSLAARIAQRALDRGAMVLFGRCSDDLAVPYQPFIEALRMATDGLGEDELRDVLGSTAGELTRLLPELAGRIPAVAEPVVVDSETQQYRLYDAISGWLQTLSQLGPIVFVVDDAHWATPSTVQLLQHVARSPGPAAVTLVVTVRDTAPDLNPKLGELVDAVRSDPANVVLQLEGLKLPAAQALLADGVDAASVVEQTAGNPLLMQAFVKTGRNVDVAAAVRHRMAGVDQRVRDALTVASVIGLDFDVKVAAAALERDESTLIDEFDEAVAARLLDDVGFDRYQFTHALVRLSLRDQLSSPRRARWHGRIAEALERVHAGRLDDVTMAIAHHYAQASLANPSLGAVAVDFLRDAASRAVDQLSFAEAIEYLEQARSLADAEDRPLQVALAIAQGEAEVSAGRHLPAIRSFDTAFDVALQANRPDLMAETALRFEDVTWRPGHKGTPSIERLQLALDALDAGDAATRARLTIALTRAHSMAGDPDSSTRAFDEAQRLLAGLDDPALETRSLTARYFTYPDDRPPPPMEPILRLRALCGEIDNVEVALLGRQIHLRTLLRYANLDEYRPALEEVVAITGDLHSTFWDYIVGNHVVMLAIYDGDLVEAERAAARSAGIGGRLVDEDTSGTLGLQMFLIRREQDRLRALEPIIRQLLAGGSTQPLWTPGLALILAEIGQRQAAASLLGEFQAKNYELPKDAMWSTIMAMLIDLAVMVGDEGSCRMLYDRFADQSGFNIVTGHGLACLGSADRYLGMLAASVGDLDLSAEHLTQAIDLDGGNGSVLWAAHDRLHLSGVRRRQGRIGEATRLRDGVLAVAETNGYAALHRLAADSPSDQAS